MTGLWAGRLLLGLLAALSLACILSGGILYGWIVTDYLAGVGPFIGLQLLGWMIRLVAAAVVSVGLLIAGIVLRLVSWSHAPLASLGLAIIAVAFVMLTYLVFSDTGNGNDSFEVVALQGACILCLILIALPPFLHWARAKPVPSQPPETRP